MKDRMNRYARVFTDDWRDRAPRYLKWCNGLDVIIHHLMLLSSFRDIISTVTPSLYNIDHSIIKHLDDHKCRYSCSKKSDTQM